MSIKAPLSGLILAVGFMGSDLGAAEPGKPLLSAAPITIEANEAILQEKQGESIYRGNVSLKQGDLSFNADELHLQSKDGHLVRMLASGHPVKFLQNNPEDKPIRAEAERIEFFSLTAKVVFSGQAILHQGSNAFSGDTIEYDINTDTVKAGSSDNTKTRVKVVIQPTAKADNANKQGQ